MPLCLQNGCRRTLTDAEIVSCGDLAGIVSEVMDQQIIAGVIADGHSIHWSRLGFAAWNSANSGCLISGCSDRNW